MDPTDSTGFAALFGVYDPSLEKLYIIDEINEKDSAKVLMRDMASQITQTIDKIAAQGIEF
jgi:hypothetical protein